MWANAGRSSPPDDEAFDPQGHPLARLALHRPA